MELLNESSKGVIRTANMSTVLDAAVARIAAGDSIAWLPLCRNTACLPEQIKMIYDDE
jgi:hypothetical protein